MNYNWDDIEVDDTLTHNSRYFFANYRHSRHEKEEEIKPEAFDSETCYSENIVNSNELQENKENNLERNTENSLKSPNYNLRSSNRIGSSALCQINNNAGLQEEIVAIDHIISNIRMDDKQEKRKVNEVAKNDNLDLLTSLNSSDTKKLINSPQTIRNIECNNDIGIPKNKPKNILTPSKWVKPAVIKTGPQTPKAYQFHNVYQNKRQEALRRQREEERKMREFNSRPAPNFQAKPSFPKIHLTTIPVTPQVLKRSKESERKRLQKLEEIKRQCPPNFKSHDPNAHKEEPFFLKKEPLAHQPCPYNLRCERRLQERKKFDQAVQAAMEEKQKQEEERRKQLDEEHVKQLRKATTFKARPNPFKN